MFKGRGNIKQLSKKFFWILLTGVVVTFGLLTFLILQREKTIILNIFREKSMENANLIAEDLISAMTEEKPWLVLHKIAALNRTEEIQIGVAGPDGQPAFNTDILIPKDIFSSQKEQFRKSGHEFILFKPLTNDDRCHRCHNARDKTRGMIVIKTSMTEAEAEVSTTAKRLLVFAFFLGLLSEIFLIIIVKKIILGPLEILSKGAEILRAGNLDHRIDIKSNDEFGALGQMFNQMASSLEDSHKHLDRSVKQKTNELQVVAEVSIEVSKGDLSLNSIIEQFLDAITNRMGYGFAGLYLVDRETGLLSNEYKKGSEDSFCPMKIALTSEHPFSKAIADAMPSVIKYTEINAPETFANIAIIPVLSHQWKRCRDINLCKHETCPAYNSDDWRCWLVQDTLCSSPQSVAGKEKIYGCLRCATFPVLGVLIAGRGPEISASSLHSLEILASETASAIENQRLIETKNEDRKKAEEEMNRLLQSLQGEKEFSEAIFNGAASAIMVLDKDSRLIKINRAGTDILGLDPGNIIGRRLTELFPETKEMLVIGNGLSREVVLSFPDGTLLPVGFNNSPLFDSSEGQKGIIVLFRDMSEVKRLQSELKKKDHFDTMGKVISGVAHEVRNPLFGISSIGQILERELDSPQHLTLIRAMLKETDRMKRLIEELLLYTRPSRLDIKEVDLAGLFAELNQYAITKKSGLKISMDIQPGATILADREKLIQVLLNILNNAIDAAQSIITVSAGNSDKTAKIEIVDDGTGISQEDLDRIFDPFFTTKKGGTGLGLPICRKLVEDHGGTIEVKSTPGKGTTVVLTFKTG